MSPFLTVIFLLVGTKIAPRLPTLHRATVGVIVLAAILGHLLEIAVFGAGYELLAPAEDAAGFDVWYHSAAAYTSLGDSQAGAVGWRLMTAVEALTGLVLITWTASFTFLVMQKNWARHEPDRTDPPARLRSFDGTPIPVADWAVALVTRPDAKRSPPRGRGRPRRPGTRGRAGPRPVRKGEAVSSFKKVLVPTDFSPAPAQSGRVA